MIARATREQGEGHWLDVGGNVPGNFNAKATESFQEGFRIPPVKLARHGVINPEDIELVHRTDSVEDAYDWIVRQLAEKALGQPGATL